MILKSRGFPRFWRSLALAVALTSTTTVFAFAAPATRNVHPRQHTAPAPTLEIPLDFIAPVKGGRMTSGFGWRVHPILGDLRFHNGVDYALPRGTPVVSSSAGTVVAVQRHKTYGRLVRVRHSGGYETVYAHLNSFAPGLAVGKKVKQGQQVGTVGTSGYATGPHLYWEVYLHGEAQDPLELLAEAHSN